MEIEKALGYSNRLDEGVIGNVGKMIVNGVKQAASNVSTAVNTAQTTVSNAAAKSEAAANSAQDTANAAKADKVIADGSGVSLKADDKATKALVATINAAVKKIDGQIQALQSKAGQSNPHQQDASQQQPQQGSDQQQPSQPAPVKESVFTLDTILLGRVQEAIDAKKAVKDLMKVKDGLTKSLSSGILTAKGIQLTASVLGSAFENDPDAKALIDKLNKSYGSASSTQKAAAAKAANGAQQQPQASVQPAQPAAAQQAPANNTGTQAAQQPSQQDSKVQEPAKPAVASQDVIKKCGAALGQISSSIDAIKAKNPAASLGQPSKDALYSSVGGDTYLDQVKAVINKVSSDLNNFVLMQESSSGLSDLKRLSEQLQGVLQEVEGSIGAEKNDINGGIR